MEAITAVSRFGALAQETRLSVLRRLVTEGPAGMFAGAIAEDVGVPASTLSFHLKELQAAGLVTATREGRQIRYAADYGALRDLVQFLLEDCCRNDPAVCGPATEGAGC